MMDIEESSYLERQRKAKELLDRIAAMLTKMGGRGYVVKDFEPTYDSCSESVSLSESGSESAVEA